MAGKPAARVSDPTAHGGVITGPGNPMVLIGGMPAACMGDMHTCPMATPGTPPIPHVGGPIIATGATVLIGGKPSARVGDMAICTGPPATIVMGCPTVLIGDGGGGGGGAGSGQDAKSQEETASSAEVEENHTLNVRFVDKTGKPITGVAYKVKTPDGKELEGMLAGLIRKSGLKEGNCDIELKAITKAEWSETEAKVGDTIKLKAEVAGVKDGAKAELRIFKRDISSADELIETIPSKVNGGKIEGEWEYRYIEDEQEDQTEGKKGYSHPKYYFVAAADGVTGRSGLLLFKDYIEVRLKDADGNAIGNESFRLFFENGEVKEGTLDQNGYKKVEHVPSGKWSVDFPNLGHVTKAND